MVSRYFIDCIPSLRFSGTRLPMMPKTSSYEHKKHYYTNLAFTSIFFHFEPDPSSVRHRVYTVIRPYKMQHTCATLLKTASRRIIDCQKHLWIFWNKVSCTQAKCKKLQWCKKENTKIGGVNWNVRRIRFLYFFYCNCRMSISYFTTTRRWFCNLISRSPLETWLFHALNNHEINYFSKNTA